jgi:hypothetical protein
MAPIGYIDGLSRGHIRGWAVDLDAPGDPVLVHVESSHGSERRHVVADRYRADVQKQGIGDGYCGFAIAARLFSPASNIRFMCGRPLRELGRFSLETARPKGRTYRRGSVVLRLDRRPAAVGLTGWTLDRQDLEARRRLLLCANGSILTTQTATLFRHDSLTEGGDGLHGFSLPPVDTSRDLSIVDASTGTAFRIA